MATEVIVIEIVNVIVIVVGTVGDQLVMTMDIGGLQGAHPIEVAVIILQGAAHLMAEDQEERGLILPMEARKESMLVALDESICDVSPVCQK
ncbi:hypothetical protein C1H46_008267 [Malus baccata]|uniref:Uncharacterized protein n=1 Tax=Malus baccata TaxID=106549 RepID=A0A540N582_MALBA|nr:hypothetical protein C1H46_008267 [Malus baccata]